ncbi:MAG TPA: hypothetical protein VN495_03205, partial [Candidatus Paceibacterota bacterium]|nr:hypothetical protein [Candidatus Paceibacterota bacterium]
EEAGIKIGALVFLFQYKATGELLRSTVRVFAGRVEDCAFRIDGIEIGEAGWFDLDKLPEHRNSRVDEALRHLAR